MRDEAGLLGAGDQGWPGRGGTGGGAFGGDISPGSTGSSSYEPPKPDKRCAAPPMAVALDGNVGDGLDETAGDVDRGLERRRTKSAMASLRDELVLEPSEQGRRCADGMDCPISDAEFYGAHDDAHFVTHFWTIDTEIPSPFSHPGH